MTKFRQAPNPAHAGHQNGPATRQEGTQGKKRRYRSWKSSKEEGEGAKIGIREGGAKHEE